MVTFCIIDDLKYLQALKGKLMQGGSGRRLEGEQAQCSSLSMSSGMNPEQSCVSRVAALLTEDICKPWSSGCPSRQQPRVHQRWGPDPGGHTAGPLRCWCRTGRSLCCQTPEIQNVPQWQRCWKTLKGFPTVFMKIILGLILSLFMAIIKVVLSQHSWFYSTKQ